MPRAKRAVNVDWYQLYYDWWELFDCNIEKCLIAYKLYNKTASNGTPREIWKSNKYHHQEEYKEAKEDYFKSLGITRSCLILRLNDLSLNSRYEKNRLDATKYLYEILDKIVDKGSIGQAQKLIVQFQDASPEDGDSSES